MPRAALTTIAVALTFCAVGCAGSVQPNDVDAARGEALLASPPFDAGAFDAEWRLEPARERMSTNFLAFRATIWTSFALDAAEPDTALAESWQHTWPTARALHLEAQGAGWQTVAATCAPPDEADPPDATGVSITMIRDQDDVTVAATIDVGGEDTDVEAVVATPFHAEADDPWAATPLSANICIEAGQPPTTPISAGEHPDLTAVPPS